MCQLFAPTKFHITFEREGKGRFTEEEIERILVRDKSGAVVSLNMPHKHILIANHQVRVLLTLRSSSLSHLLHADLRRLVVCLVTNVSHGYSQGRLHRIKEPMEMGPNSGMGKAYSSQTL